MLIWKILGNFPAQFCIFNGSCFNTQRSIHNNVVRHLRKMENLIKKSTEEIKNQIEFWFFKYYGKTKSDFTGNEIFTLFELLDSGIQNKILKQLNFIKTEIPVLFLKISDSEFIINTTKKFIRIDNSTSEFLNYSDFQSHNGFKSIVAETEKNGKKIGIKTDGYVAEFGLRKRNGEIIFWNIPTGEPGFGFWNVTNKFQIIGRKYITTE